jgi:gliding motility-associated-like protein
VDPQFSGVTSANGGVYTFIVRNDTNNCTAKSTVNVVVNTPDSPAVTSPVIYCLNNKAESLTASGKDLLWYAPAASAPASIAPVVPTQTIADYIYYVTQMSGNCESPRSEIAVSVIRCCDGDLFIPSAFSPNNDGLNDYFQPHPAFGYFIKAVSVYNRWGQLVYSGTEGKWNGKFGLTDADAGTYYYSIIFGCILGGTAERHGDVTLVR